MILPFYFAIVAIFCHFPYLWFKEGLCQNDCNETHQHHCLEVERGWSGKTEQSSLQWLSFKWQGSEMLQVENDCESQTCPISSKSASKGNKKARWGAYFYLFPFSCAGCVIDWKVPSPLGRESVSKQIESSWFNALLKESKQPWMLCATFSPTIYLFSPKLRCSYAGETFFFG